jgi:hypothetical protein
MRTLPRKALLAPAAIAALALAGCGSDSSGQDTTAASVSIPTVTSPLATSTGATTTAPAKQKPGPTTTAGTGGGSAPCSIPDAFQDLKFSGIDCAGAVAVAQAWDSNGKQCNTVDNPESPIGPQRTCSVNGYSCTAKRDVTSDARFVTCTQGDTSVRFTWLPA